MAKISGLERLLRTFKRLQRQAKSTKYTASVSVGFAMDYALAVHERVLWKHRVGQAKYLQTALQTLRSSIRAQVIAMVKGGGRLSTALLIVGLQVQKAAQKLTPVDTGALKASAFTSLTRNEAAAAQTAYDRGESRRAKVLAKRP